MHLDFATEREFASSDYYNDFLARQGLRWSAAVGAPTADGHWAISIRRTVEQGPFRAGEQAALLRSRPAFREAIEITQRLGEMRTRGILGIPHASAECSVDRGDGTASPDDGPSISSQRAGSRISRAGVKTCTGISTFLLSLMSGDLAAGCGFALLDSHGDLASRRVVESA